MIAVSRSFGVDRHITPSIVLQNKDAPVCEVEIDDARPGADIRRTLDKS